MKSIYNRRVKSINNRKGVAIVVVILVFVVTTILGASAVSLVYSDNMFSQHQEETKQAQFAARSAVTVVEKAIKDKLADLEEKEQQMNDAIADYLTQTEEPALTQKYDIMQEKITTRNDLFEEIFGTVLSDVVLPFSTGIGVTHQVAVSGSDQFDIDQGNIINVSVTKQTDNVYRLESLTTVTNGNRTAKGKAIRVITIESNPEIVSTALPKGWFEDALWAKNTITVGNNNHVITGNVTYGIPPAPSAIEMDAGYTIRLRDTEEELPPEPIDFFNTLISSNPAIETLDDTITFYSGSGNNKSITQANNAHYTNTSATKIKFDSTYQVNTGSTGSGDVILRINYADIDSNKVEFIVSGDNDFIVYIGSMSSAQDKNNVTFKSTGGADIYLIFEGDATNFTKNNIYGSNLYIYAPNSDLDFKNNVGGEGNGQGVFKGAIIAKSIKINNNADIKYVPTKQGKNTLFNRTTETNDGEDTEQTIYNYSPYFSGKWLKE
ncbi:MAG: hypothetical protein CVU86_08715 [Firmicutes bacterium HGW-Firmicutes-11]|jgi:Tfp pilus assembly protein PilX|nr:MAG: hypothetical protein CVU86_08715 [Firmicutes bacterium HGW-Firmicutes-11]